MATKRSLRDVIRTIHEVAQPKSKDEQRFKAKHVVHKTQDVNGNGDDVFNATKIKPIDLPKELHGHDAKRSEKVYEAVAIGDAVSHHEFDGDDYKGKVIGFHSHPTPRGTKGIVVRKQNGREESTHTGEWLKEGFGAPKPNQTTGIQVKSKPNAFKKTPGPNKTLNSPVREDFTDWGHHRVVVTKGDHAGKTGMIVPPEGSNKPSNDHYRVKFDSGDHVYVHKNVLTNESVEPIQEVSKKLLGRYIKAANQDYGSLQRYAGRDAISPSEKKTMYNRRAGISKAVDRLTTEDVVSEAKFSLNQYEKMRAAPGPAAEAEKARKSLAVAKALKAEIHGRPDVNTGKHAKELDRVERLITKHATVLQRHGLKEDTVSEARLLHSYDSADGKRSAKVYRDHEWDDHIVKYYKNGVHQKNADSHHYDDKEDAHSSAKHFVKESAQSANTLTPMRTKPKGETDFLKPRKTKIRWDGRHKRGASNIGEDSTVRTADARAIPVRDVNGRMTWRHVKAEIRIGDKLKKDDYVDPNLKEDFETWNRVNARRTDTLLRHTHLYKTDQDDGETRTRKDLRKRYKKMGYPPIKYPYKTSDSLKESAGPDEDIIDQMEKAARRRSALRRAITPNLGK